MGYRSTPHPARGHTLYEALMKRNMRTELDNGHFSKNRNLHNMEKEITKQDKEYKSKWSNKQRRPKCKEHHFQIGDKVLLKKKKLNIWSTRYEKDFDITTEIHGSTITAKRKSDRRTIDKDVSRFRFFHDVTKDNWREWLLPWRLTINSKQEGGRKDQTGTQPAKGRRY